MAAPLTDSRPERTEADEQFRALMEGLRTTLPGVQVLFGFLLALPFQSDFAQLTQVDRVLYYIAFVGSALASVLMLAPAAHQRVRASETGIIRRSLSHVEAATRLTVIGTACLLIALGAAVYVVSRIVFGDWLAAAGLGLVAGIAAFTWFVQPLFIFERNPGHVS